MKGGESFFRHLHSFLIKGNKGVLVKREREREKESGLAEEIGSLGFDYQPSSSRAYLGK